TDGGDLPARHVIHTVGPIWGVRPAEASARLLADCYRNSLDLAMAHGCFVVAFPNISTGAFGYPKREAAEVAVTAVTQWTGQNPVLEKVVFVCFRQEDQDLYREFLPA
ncbi:MAG TPA: macro domain-containing protein, partial [Acidimicrobiia bacterium]